MAFSSRILLIVCLWLAKFSVALFTRRLFSGDMNHERLVFAIAFATLLTSGLAAVLTSSIGCNPGLLLGSEHSGCQKVDVRWIVVCMLDVVSELVLLAVPTLLLVPIQMRAAKKRKVWLYYSSRLG